MKNLIVVIIGLLSFACVSTPRKQTYYNQGRNFNYIIPSDAFKLKVTEFIENKAYCYTEGIPYALIIGNSIDENLPSKISVLAMCDNNNYRVGDTLTIAPIENPTKEGLLTPIYITKDATLNGERYRSIVGSENPAVWGKVL